MSCSHLPVFFFFRKVCFSTTVLGNLLSLRGSLDEERPTDDKNSDGIFLVGAAVVPTIVYNINESMELAASWFAPEGGGSPP